VATLLYRLGRASYRRAWLVIGAWVVLLAAVLGGGLALGGQSQESFEIPGTESQDALDLLSAVFPQVAGASAQAVVVAPEGDSVEDERYREPIDELAEDLRDVDGVEQVVGPFDEYAGDAVSADGSIARVQVQFDGPSSEVTDAMLDELTATAGDVRDAGLRVEFGGQVFQDDTVGITVTEAFGVVFAGLVLVITFGSLLAAGMPLLSALIGVGIVMGGIVGVSAFTTVSSSAPLLALMIGLAVGIDYSLFILSRHRGQLARGDDPEESAATAVGTAGSAVVFAGLTVIIALLGLLVVGIPFLSVMGVGAAFAVLVAIAVATTLLPAILGLAGARLAPRRGSRAWRRAHGEGRRTMGLGWARLVLRAPVVFAIAVVAVLGTLALPALSLDLNLPDGGSEERGSTQRAAYDLVSEGFGPGYNGPLVVAIDITQTTDVLGDLEGIGAELGRLDDVEQVGRGIPDPGLDTAIIQVTPESAPDSPETKALVEAIRDLAPRLEREYDVGISVTGTTAVGIDISNRLTGALVPFGVIVVGLSIVLLAMVFRSILVPVTAALGFLLSVIASFGVVVAVFQWGWLGDLIGVEDPGPILSFMPIILMAVLFGLAMDYQVFLVSGMRERFVRTGDARESVAVGFADGARVVTAAALIMFFVFFAFVPEGSGTIKPIALGLAVGIAFDAFLVRMTLVPALMAMLGRSAWWLPRRLARALPDVDIEGEGLREHREAVDWASASGDAVLAASGLRVDDGAPLTLRVPRGALVVATGGDVRRRLVAATLAGRLEPLGGRAQVMGHPLPSEAARVRSLVALADIGHGGVRDAARLTAHDLLLERIALTVPWHRMRTARRRAAAELERLVAVLPADSPLRPDSLLAELPPLERAVILAGAALAERTPVVMLDASDLGVDLPAVLGAISALAPADTTVLVAAAASVETVAAARSVVHLDLDAPTRSAGAHAAATQESLI